MVLGNTKDDKVFCSPRYFVPNFLLDPKTIRTRLVTRQHCKHTPFSIRDSRNPKLSSDDDDDGNKNVRKQ